MKIRFCSRGGKREALHVSNGTVAADTMRLLIICPDRLMMPIIFSFRLRYNIINPCTCSEQIMLIYSSPCK